MPFCRMADFGSGIALSQGLDLQITPAGDLETVDGLDELEKDLSFRLIDALTSLSVQTLTPETRDDVRATVKGVLVADLRVETVTGLTVETAPGLDSSLTVTVEVETAEGPFDLVVSV